MLEINPEIVCNIILKAREFNAKDEVAIAPEEPGDYAAGYDYLQVLADYKDDLSYLEIKNIIDNLEPDQQEELIAIMYLGRGDYTIEEFNVACEQAKTVPPENRADYLIAKPLLADYLEEGLTMFDYSCDT